MATITQLKVQKKNKERVSVFLDGEYAFSVGLLTAASLKREQELSEQEIDDLRREGDTHFAYQRAIRYLSYRPRSIAETRKYLEEKGYDSHIIESVLSKLEQQGFLDDQAFARFWVESREQFRPRGRRALQYELRQKGISQAEIDETLEGYEEGEAAWNTISGRLQRWQGLDEFAFKQRVMGFLNRRGFPYGVCRDVVERAWSVLQEGDGEIP